MELVGIIFFSVIILLYVVAIISKFKKNQKSKTIPIKNEPENNFRLNDFDKIISGLKINEGTSLPEEAIVVENTAIKTQEDPQNKNITEMIEHHHFNMHKAILSDAIMEKRKN
jgi:hypothetical protein